MEIESENREAQVSANLGPRENSRSVRRPPSARDLSRELAGVIGPALAGFLLVSLGAATFFARFDFRAPDEGVPAATTVELALSIGLTLLFALGPVLVGGWIIFRSLNPERETKKKSE